MAVFRADAALGIAQHLNLHAIAMEPAAYPPGRIEQAERILVGSGKDGQGLFAG